MSDASVTATFLEWLSTGYLVLKVIIGFSIIIFVHELGHFLAAKWMGVRVERFAVGFFTRLVGYRRGEGVTFGPRRPEEYAQDKLREKGYGETDYCLNALPFGGYVKMMGEDDILINEQTGEVKTTSDPRAFTNKPVGRRMVVVSAGVVFNVLFAVLLYVVVFLFLGRQAVAPVIGRVTPGSPASEAGLAPGDRVLEIDGKPVRSFEDIYEARLLAEKPLLFRVERDGRPLPEPVRVAPGLLADGDFLRDLDPMLTTELVARSDGAAHPVLRAGDRITQVAGQSVRSAYEIVVAFQRGGGRPLELTVERPDPQAPGVTRTLTVTQPAVLEWLPALSGAGSAAEAADSTHLLGFRRRQVIREVVPNSPAACAGFQAGDVIAQWENVANPLYGDIIRSIETKDDQAVPVVVERAGQPVTVTVTPKRPVRVFGSAPPKVGIAFGGDDPRPVVADVVPDTPAAELGVPRGTELLAIGDRSTPNWHAVFEALKAAAGTTVAVRYRVGEEEATGLLRIPSSLVNELDLPPTALIRSINGATSVVTESGRKLSLPSVAAVRKLLERHVGQTVTVEYVPSLLDHATVRRSFDVRADNTDPWQLRAIYNHDLGLGFKPLTERLTAGGNPVRALGMGLKKTGDVLVSVYRILKSVVKGTVTQSGGVGVEHVSGPIGIVRLAVAQAESGFGDLLFFLAYISVNLAVINFIPLPVVDGGLMVFLLLEKIRGKPVNLKVQVITTLAGLALIVLVFVLVTFQDIAKWWSGGL